MPVSVTFSAKREQMQAIQEVVKAHGLYFVSNPAAWMHLPSLRVEVAYDDADPAPFHEAMARIDQITLPAPPLEPKRGWLARLFA